MRSLIQCLLALFAFDHQRLMRLNSYAAMPRKLGIPFPGNPHKRLLPVFNRTRYAPLNVLRSPCVVNYAR